MRTAFDAVTPNLFLYDSFGSVDPDNLIERLRYMATGLECDALFLDHISIAISGLEDIDERRALDVMMTKLRSLVEETGVAMFVVSHLKRPSQGDRGHEQGLQVSLSQLRGSHAIAQLSDMVIGLERNQQGENPNETVVRVLKNRFSGETGVTGALTYSTETGRLTEQPFKPEDTPF
jgi:twinkle protein